MCVEEFGCDPPSIGCTDKCVVIRISDALPFLHYFCHSSSFRHIQNINVVRRIVIRVRATLIDEVEKAMDFMPVLIWVRTSLENYGILVKIRCHDGGVPFVAGLQIFFDCSNDLFTVRKVSLVHFISSNQRMEAPSSLAF